MSLPFLAASHWSQIGIVVDDLHSALESHARSLPHASWSVYTYSADVFAERTWHGGTGSFSMQIALSDTSPQIELIEPLEGPSIYDGWLGIHHVGLYVPSLAESIASMQAQGFEPIQTGTGYGATGDGGFAYFDTTRQLAMIIEAIERPAVRREPDFVLRGGSAAGLL